MNILAIFILSIIIFALALMLWFTIKDARKKNAAVHSHEIQLSALQNELDQYKSQYEKELQKTEQLSQAHTSSILEAERLREKNSYLNKQLAEKERKFERIQTQLKSEFQNLSKDMLSQSAEALDKHNKKSLSEIVDPLKERLNQYQKLLSDFREKDIKDRSILTTEIKQLQQLNQQLSKDAQNLAGALKNDQKMQGNWGEMILEKILEQSGLEKNFSYKTQFSTNTANQNRIQPDVVVFLPDERHLIIDAKVSLTAFEQLVNGETTQERNDAMQKHISSIKNHIKNLSEKKYDTAEALNSPEFIFMFMPIENALSIALRADETLHSLAWSKRIVLVTPSTLMATLMTVANLWRTEKQHQFAERIAEETGKLYDKFATMLETVNDLGQKIDNTQNSYDLLIKQLKEGRGNLINRTEKIKEMGISHKKSLPSNFKNQNKE